MTRDTKGFLQRFHRFSRFCLYSIFLLIFVGALVRSTGAGMGCPDWPKCFDRWIPPVSEAQLPADYQERYKDHGYADVPFNVVKTWTEYLNRLLGVAIGFFVLALFILSLPLWKSHPALVWLSGIIVLSVGIQGGIGAMVVASNLTPYLVTVHMFVAIVIVALLQFAVFFSIDERLEVPPIFTRLRSAFIGLAVAMMAQIVLGTRVREGVDELALALNFEQRDLWLSNVPHLLEAHRFFALILLGLMFWLAFRLPSDHALSFRLRRRLIVLTVSTIVFGIVLVYFHFPAWAQPLHLLLAIMLFSALVDGVLLSRRA